MRIKNRFMTLALGGAVSLAVASQAHGQEFPAKPLTIIVPLPAGSTVDALARVFARELSTQLKQQVIVENKPGAAMVLGMQALARAQADGHTLAFAPITPISIQLHRNKEAGYRVDSFEPLCGTFTNHFYLAVNQQNKAKDIQSLVASMKSEPGKFTYGHTGTASGPHVLGIQLFSGLGVTATDVPYKGETPVVPDIMGGAVDSGIVTGPSIRQGNLRPLVVFGNDRSKWFPAVPSTGEIGVKNVAVGSGGGLFVPKSTPPAAVAKLKSACQTAVTSEAYQRQADTMMMNANYVESGLFAKHIREDYESKGKLLSTLNLKD